MCPHAAPHDDEKGQISHKEDVDKGVVTPAEASISTASVSEQERKLVRKLYDKADALPRVLTLENIKSTSLEEVGGGGYSDVYRGYSDGGGEKARQWVALKRIRLHGFGHDKATVTRVCLLAHSYAYIGDTSLT